ncbi:MAG: SusC/RagA family TonB-linked outer membrane protein [Bacteroidetes bacterium]|nr:SusC/RagA family TonB-linked outer membrane protein [Bacteroidota bacterium]
MKFFVFFLIVGMLQVSAKSNAQNISISGKDIPLKKVFKEIKQQAGYVFFYDAELLKQANPVTIDIRNLPVEKALDVVFKDQPLTWRLENRTITVVSRPWIEPISTQELLVPPPVTIKGKITDDNDEAVSGVTIMVKGSTNGTQSDVNGDYSITNVADNAILVFTSIGHETKEVSVANRKVINVVLNIKIKGLAETVVVAYGTSKVKDVTGSISHIGVKEIKNAPMGSSIQSLLPGRAAGVNVQIQPVSPTTPVSVIIRGASSLTGDNQPLWVIDGVPDYSTSTSGNIYNTLYNLNLNDVESIDILKDASATALYGSRAANGVVIVTTKKGRIGQTPTIEVSSRLGYQQMNFNGYKYMTAPDYLNFAEKAAREEAFGRGAFDYFTRLYLDEQAFMNLNTSEFDRSNFKVLKGAFYNGNTNWLNEMTHNPWNQQYDLTLRGGTQGIAYYVSLFTNQADGIVKTGNSKLYGGRVNLEATLHKGIKFGLNLNGSSRKTNDKDYMLDVLKKVRPDIPPYNPDGTLFTRDAYTENPYTTLLNTQQGNGQSFNGTGFLEFTIMKGLLLKSAYTSSYANSQYLKYKRRGSTFNYNGARNWTNDKVLTNVWENTLTLAKNFGKHDILGLVGFSMEKNSIEHYGMSASNFPDDDVLNDLGSGATIGALSESYTANSLISGFARATYKYNNRYIVSGTIRRDGSSRFGPDKRWGLFPSGAIAWLISEENFMKTPVISKIVSYLKLRASIGRTGSQNLGNYDWRTGIGSARFNELPAIAPNSIGNPDLQWEQTKMTDVGLDYGFWQDRLRGTFGVYQKITDFLIYSKPLPPSSSFSSISSNVASVKNNGVEFDIKGDVIRKKNLTVTLDFNAGRNINRILTINGITKELNFPSDYTIYMKVKEGQRTGQWYGYQTANRLFVTQEEIIAMQRQTSTGAKQYYQNSLESPGDLIFIDQNGDGKIDANDKTILGNSDPKWFGGFGATAIYKNFMVNATFTYSYGNERLWLQPMSDASYIGNYNQSNLIAGKSATLYSPYEASMPRMTMYGDGGNGSSLSDFWLYDASYVRLSALNVSYRVPSKIVKSLVIQGIDLTFQASNLFTITKYPGFDPQGNWSSSSIGGMGVDYSYYPAAKNYNLGIKFTFK